MLNLLLQTQGLSGRALRRLPVLALARYIGIGNVQPVGIKSSTTINAYGSTQDPNEVPSGASGADVEVWLEAMEKVVKQQANELKRLI